MAAILDDLTEWRYNGAMSNVERPIAAKVNVRFPASVIQAMRELAREDQRSLNSEIIWALREFIERRNAERQKTVG